MNCAGDRFTADHVEAWRHDGGVLIQRFFTDEEVSAVCADFELVFGRTEGGDQPLEDKPETEPGRFDPTQFTNIEPVPLKCSPALNLIGVHPAIIAFAKAALGCERVHNYQCQAWAKYTGDADYDQPFHCDFVNHTLTTPSEDERDNSVTILCYFTDVTEAHGPMHYALRSETEHIAGPEATLERDPEIRARLQADIARCARSSASPAGSIFPYAIDTWHRGTNLTAPNGRRFALMTCFKRADNDVIGYHAWPFHFEQPWSRIFNHASPEQLACFGVQPPGHPFWTETTLARAQARYPGWDMTPYREALTSG
jgi:hypothetical protein